MLTPGQLVHKKLNVKTMRNTTRIHASSSASSVLRKIIVRIKVKYTYEIGSPKRRMFLVTGARQHLDYVFSVINAWRKSKELLQRHKGVRHQECHVE